MTHSFLQFLNVQHFYLERESFSTKKVSSAPSMPLSRPSSASLQLGRVPLSRQIRHSGTAPRFPVQSSSQQPTLAKPLSTSSGKSNSPALDRPSSNYEQYLDAMEGCPH